MAIYTYPDGTPRDLSEISPKKRERKLLRDEPKPRARQKPGPKPKTDNPERRAYSAAYYEKNKKQVRSTQNKGYWRLTEEERKERSKKGYERVKAKRAQNGGE